MPSMPETRRRRRKRGLSLTYVITAVSLLILCGVVAAAVLFTPSPYHRTPMATPRPAVAIDVPEAFTVADATAGVLDQLNEFRSGDYGDSWDRWPISDQKIMSRAGYTKIYTLCRDLLNGVAVTPDLIKVTLIPPRRGRVVVNGGMGPGDTVTRRIVLEGARWRMYLDDDQRDGYRTSTPDRIARQLRAAGLCANPAPTSTPSPRRASAAAWPSPRLSPLSAVPVRRPPAPVVVVRSSAPAPKPGKSPAPAKSAGKTLVKVAPARR